MRLKDKVAVIIGAGQSPGETVGNGRATVLRFAQEGARIFAVDRDLDSANETAAMARAEGAESETARADVTRDSETELVQIVLRKPLRIGAPHSHLIRSVRRLLSMRSQVSSLLG